MSLIFIPTQERLAWEIYAIDLNRDGTKDFIVFDDSTNKLIAITSNGSGSWSENNQIFLGGNPITAATSDLLFADINGDGYRDLIVYGLGPQINGKFQGAEPLLYVGGATGIYTKSNLLDNVYQLMINQTSSNLYNWGQTDLTVSAKSITSADINGDGSIDLWIESSGGWNASGHFLINSNNGFTPTQSLIKPFDYWGNNYVGWRYSVSKFIDINQDGFSDLVMGQMRAHTWQIDETSKIFINNGNGSFPTSKIINLPAPAFNDGWTKVLDLSSGDLNNDGLTDLVLVHTRYGDTTAQYNSTSWIGTYIQILMQNKDGYFVDQSWRLGDQTAWDQLTNTVNRYAETVQLLDINKDGKLDIVLTYPWNISPNNADCPLVFTQSEYSTFSPVDSNIFNQGNAARSAFATDIKDDGNISFVSIGASNGDQGISINTLDLTSLHSIITISRVMHDGAYYALDLDSANSAGGIYRLYQAAFDRKPDLGGLGYWIKAADNGKSAVTMAEDFTWSKEFLDLFHLSTPKDNYFTGVDVKTLVEGMYTHVLHRAADSGGLNYYAGVIQSHEKTVGRVLAEISDSPENHTAVASSIANGIQYTPYTAQAMTSLHLIDDVEGTVAEPQTMALDTYSSHSDHVDLVGQTHDTMLNWMWLG